MFAYKKSTSYLVVISLFSAGVIVALIGGAFSVPVENNVPLIVSNKLLYNSTILPITPQPTKNICWEAPNMSWQEIKSSGSPLEGGGLAMGMGADDISPLALPKGINTFAINADTPILANYHFWLPESPNNSSPITLELLVILNEQALESAIQPPSRLTLFPGDELTLTLTIPALPQGVHDLIIFGLINPETEPDPYGIVNSFANRFTFLVGKEPKLVDRVYEGLPAEGWISKGAPQMALELSLSPTLTKIWNWPEKSLPMSPNHELEYYIFAGYIPSQNANAPELPLPEKMPFALLVFHNMQQIAVTSNKQVFYGFVQRDVAYTQVNGQVTVGDLLGQQNLLILRVDYPGIPMCILRGPYNEQSYIFNYNVFARRVAIDVKP